jgi:hypothetical protein
LPPLFLVWANLHGGVGLGLLAIGAVLMVETIRTRRLPWPLIGVFVACLAATALTPLRLELWTLLATYGQKGKISRISEWMAPEPPPAYLAFWAIAVLLLVSAVLFVRRSDRTAQRLTAISLIALPLALSAHRQVPAFLLVAMPATAALLDTARRRTAPRPPARDHNLVNTGLATLAVVVAGVWVLSLRSQPPPRLNWRPIAEDAILAVRTCQAPFYNAFDLGGVLIWFVREQPVFIDNRNDPYPATLLERSLDVETTGDYRALFDEYGIRCAAVEVDTPTERTLRQDRRWLRTYADDRHAVYIRPGS